MKVISALLVGVAVLHHAALGLATEQTGIQLSSDALQTNGLRGIERQAQVKRGRKKVYKKSATRGRSPPKVKKVATRKKVTKRGPATRRKRVRAPRTKLVDPRQWSPPTTTVGTRTRPGTGGSTRTRPGISTDRTRPVSQPEQPEPAVEAAQPERTGSLRQGRNPQPRGGDPAPKPRPEVTPKQPTGM